MFTGGRNRQLTAPPALTRRQMPRGFCVWGISSPPRTPPSKIHAERRSERAAKEHLPEVFPPKIMQCHTSAGLLLHLVPRASSWSLRFHISPLPKTIKQKYIFLLCWNVKDYQIRRPCRLKLICAVYMIKILVIFFLFLKKRGALIIQQVIKLSLDLVDFYFCKTDQWPRDSALESSDCNLRDWFYFK